MKNTGIRFTPYDGVVLSYCAIVAVLIVATRARIPSWGAYLCGHAAIAFACVGLAAGQSRSSNRLLRFVRDWDIAVYVPALFLMTCVLVHRVHPIDYDAQLIAIDRRIGGIAVLRWMERIQTPFLTDFSKLLWVSYYFIVFVPGIPLYVRGTRDRFEGGKLLLVLTFLVSYLGYFAWPAQGPGYMQQEIGVGQPKWEESKVSPALKETIHALEGEARDTFPSGHVMISAMAIVLCIRNRLWKSAAVTIPLALGIMWSTVYLRYHYLVDGLVGLALVAILTWVGVRWSRTSVESPRIS